MSRKLILIFIIGLICGGFLFQFFGISIPSLEIKLSILQTFFDCLVVVSILVAFLTYYYQKQHDKKLDVIDQVSFFRKDVMVIHRQYYEQVERDKNELPRRIKIDKADIEYVFSVKPADVQSQWNLSQKYYQTQLDVLNLVEELSLRITYSGTENHPALNQIKTPFVEIVESHAVALLRVRQLDVGEPTYNTILYLYDKWKDCVDRRNANERMSQTWAKLIANSK